jgi:predicted metalloprotease with PDZ domain
LALQNQQLEGGTMIGVWMKCASAALVAVGSSIAVAQTAPITLSVDLTDAPRKILHATEVMPVTPGPLTVVYPKWIPGEHGPTGPIENMAGFFITANGQPVKWERDKVDMFAYHVTVPQGVTKLEMKIDFLASSSLSGFSAGGSTSENLALLSWNTLLVYPADTDASQVMFTPSITIPSGWKFGTALDKDGGSGQMTTFKTVSLEQLIDSPVLAGRYFREVPLAPEITPKHYLDMAADGPEEVELSKEHIADFDRLVRETGALYRSRHYGSYHFLVTLSDEVAHFGLEHHQSSDDRVTATTFTDDREFVLDGLLLPHEFTHSWNGKYRRPAGLATSNYQKPMEGDLLWVYEGLTEYLGDVLAARCGIWTPEQYKQRLSTIAALYDNRPGRTWRDIQDTATSAQILYAAGAGWDNWRLNVDYYDEGELIWLDVDTTIRKMTDSKKSIDDFVAKFHGLGGDTGPKVVPYTFEDVVAGLNGVVANDWATFLRTRLDSNAYQAPLGGLENGGYKLTYSDKPNAWSAMEDAERGNFDFWYSIGLHAGKSGTVSDVLKGGIADKAGIGPGMKIVAVNGRAYTPDFLKAAIHDSKDSGPAVELIVMNTGYYKVVRLDYHGGERYPQLERVSSAPDRLDDILKPHAK